MKFSTKKEDLKMADTEQLQQEAKVIKIASISFSLLLIVLLCIGTYVSMYNIELLSFVAVPFILSPILYVFAKKKFMISEELKSRKI